MKAEKTITICGNEVAMRYCTAAETGYEQLSGKSAEIFIPDIEKDADGNVTRVTQRAKTDDYIKLSIAAIIAAYARRGEDAPVTTEDIIFDATPKEVSDMLTTVIQLRNQWYDIPTVVKPETEESPEQQKND
jgi:hypothetical protein